MLGSNNSVSTQLKQPKKTEPKTIGCAILLVIIFIFGLAFCNNINKSSNSSSKKSDDSKVVAVTKKVDSRTPEKKFVDDDLDRLIKSASSLTDSTWEYYVTEPLDNYSFGLATTESITTNLELAVSLFESKALEVENFEIPKELIYKAHVEEYLNKLLVDLGKAIRGRADVATHYIESINSGKFAEITEEEASNLLIMPNTHLQIAAIDYKFVLENVE
ncbi:hypothetical protein PMSD_18320 [Paenibacillus macquariensis subsp. defensor]|nr:hypothetical protein PMSD_18320 [Paenibacillus macquariensis subsp. defensor]